MLRAAEKVLDFLEPIHHGQRMRIEELRKVFEDPQQILRLQEFLNTLTAANQTRFAQGGPSLSALVPYVDQVEMARLREEEKAMRAKIVLPPKATGGDIEALRPAVTALGERLAVERKILEHFRDLQQRVIIALDTTEPPRTDNADTNADSKSSSRVRLPKNPDVLRLAKDINDRGDKELSQIDIARQFTGGNEKRAKSLLRQLRRYPHLLRKPRQ